MRGIRDHKTAVEHQEEVLGGGVSHLRLGCDLLMEAIMIDGGRSSIGGWVKGLQ